MLQLINDVSFETGSNLSKCPRNSVATITYSEDILKFLITKQLYMNIEYFQTILLEKRILQKFLEICFNASHLLKHMTDTGTFSLKLN